MGGPGDEGPSGVIIDETGSIYVAGAFQRQVDFDPGPGKDLHIALDDPCDCRANSFLTKLTSEGDYLWTISFRPVEGSAAAYAFARDVAGNLILAGYLGGLVDFDPGPAVDAHLGGSDIFVTKLHDDGTYVWTRTFGGGGYDYGSDVGVDREGNIYVTGIFRGTADFDPGPDEDYHRALLRPIFEDTFVTKLLPDGSYGWTITYPVFSNDQIAVSPEGDIVLTGSFNQAVDFDPTPAVDMRTPVPPPPGTGTGGDIFVTKIRADQSYAWTYAVGSPSLEKGEAALIMPDGGVLVLGTFREPLDFDPGPDKALASCRLYGSCEFLLRLNGDGSFAWVRTTPEASSLPSRAIVLDAEGSVYYTRWLLSTDVDPTCGFDFRTPTGPGGADIFLTKLLCNAAPGDADGDGDVDLFDLGKYQNCFTGGPNTHGIVTPCAAGCEPFDLTPDNALDLSDFAAFQILLTGP